MQLPESLTHKLGPLPVWGWGAIIGGAWLAVGFLHGGSASSAAAGPFATAPGGDSGGDSGDSGAYGGALNSPDTTSPVTSGSGISGGGSSSSGGGGATGGSASVGAGGSSAGDTTKPPDALTGGIDTPVTMTNPNAGASSTNTNAPSGPSATYVGQTATKSSATSAPSLAGPSAGNVVAPLVGTGKFAQQVQAEPKVSPTVTVATPAGSVQVPTAVANLLGAASVQQVAAAAAQRPAQKTGSLTAPSKTSTKVAAEPTPAPAPKPKTKQENTGSISAPSKTSTKAQ